MLLTKEERVLSWGYGDGWTHDPGHGTGHMRLAAVYQPHVLTAGVQDITPCRTTWEQWATRGCGRQAFSVKRMRSALVSTGGCGWLVWIILQADRELKLVTQLVPCEEGCLATGPFPWEQTTEENLRVIGYLRPSWFQQMSRKHITSGLNSRIYTTKLITNYLRVSL